MSEQPEHELLFKVHRVKNKTGDWIPAIQDITSHDITPIWAAGVAYIILDRYLSCVDDSKQKEFQEEMLFWLAKMLKNNEAAIYVEKMKFPNSME
jgi:hypothetical protein